MRATGISAWPTHPIRTPTMPSATSASNGPVLEVRKRVQREVRSGKITGS